MNAKPTPRPVGGRWVDECRAADCYNRASCVDGYCERHFVTHAGAPAAEQFERLKVGLHDYYAAPLATGTLKMAVPSRFYPSAPPPPIPEMDSYISPPTRPGLTIFAERMVAGFIAGGIAGGIIFGVLTGRL